MLKYHLFQKFKLIRMSKFNHLINTLTSTNNIQLTYMHNDLWTWCKKQGISQNTKNKCIPSSQRFDTYLGLLALVEKSRTAVFRNIIDKVWKKLHDWKLKFLLQAGREILLKAVIQAIPTYCMSVFLLLRALC
jgi:hypothetical protein